MSATACCSLQATSETSGLYQGPLAADLLRQAPTLYSEESAVSLIHLAFDSLRPLDGTACSSLQATSESSGSSQHPLAAVLPRQASSQGLRPKLRFLPRNSSQSHDSASIYEDLVTKFKSL